MGESMVEGASFSFNWGGGWGQVGVVVAAESGEDEVSAGVCSEVVEGGLCLLKFLLAEWRPSLRTTVHGCSSGSLGSAAAMAIGCGAGNCLLWRMMVEIVSVASRGAGDGLGEGAASSFRYVH